jgi:FKBP-type peptidyl-prolyl cis-trans isomerase
MKKLSILFTAAMLVMGMSFASCSKTSGSKMKTAVDSLSYAYGVGMGTNLAQNLEQFPAKLNVDLFLATFEKALKGDTADLAITPQQAYEVFQRCLQTAQLEAAAETKKEVKKFMEKNAKADGVKTTPSGLQYQVLKEGNGPKPTDSSTVRVHYHGTLIDGTVFDSSVDRGTPAEIPLNRVIKGWTEGIKLMSVGSKYKFWIPSELAYGDNGAGGKIKPGSMLIFEVELLGIQGVTPEPAASIAPAAPTK